MPFEQGNQLGKGRPPGATNKKTEAWNKLGMQITGEWADKIIEHGNQLIKDKKMDEFFIVYERMLNYFKPKQATTTIQAEIRIPDLSLSLRTPEAIEAMNKLLALDQKDDDVEDAEVVE